MKHIRLIGRMKDHQLPKPAFLKALKEGKKPAINATMTL